ncbi:MAG: hypothetical protein RMM29_01135 [Planctomycetota bacterium]|nr:hypothetical protein [Planctomycetota bacterium]MCX8039662.1 hypothetical protein [Planctomycetota bacterium]MDW8372240.1 hypothetical protein [Planctomycetota bacterium]
MRAGLLLALAGLLPALSYDPRPEQVVFYRWVTEQRVQWESAGDRLQYETRIAWDLGLRCAAVEATSATLALSFIRVQALHRGPATEIVLDSARGAGADDPLLGHLYALVGQTLRLQVERASGRVLRVEGAEEIVAAVQRRAPASMPGEPSPLAAQAEALWGAAAWQRLWSQILALPRPEDDEVPLPAPFSGGALRRSWQGQRWQLRVPDGAAPRFVLASDPTPVQGSISALRGEGEIALAEGLPSQLRGRLALTLAIEAMTQPVSSQHEIAWELRVQEP